MTTIATQDQRLGLVATFAAAANIPADKALSVLKETIIPGGKATDAQVMMFLSVANQYNLNPFTREIYAFPAKGGGIQPIVGVDGWMSLANGHPQFDGVEFSYEEDGETIISCTCSIYRKDRSRPIVVSEYLKECAGNTEPWRKWPRRMLRHKAYIQAARLAFGLAGIVDEDEAERMREVGAVVVPEPSKKAKEIREKIATARKAPPAPPAPQPVEETPPFETEAEAEAVDPETGAVCGLVAERLAWIEGARNVDAGIVSTCLGRMTPEVCAESDSLFERFKAEVNAKFEEGSR